MASIETHLRNLKAKLANISFLSKEKKSCCSGKNVEIPIESSSPQALANYTQKGLVR